MRFVASLAVVLMLSLSPFVVTENGAVQTQVACANGSCCPFDGAICGLNGQNFEDRDYNAGSCDGGEEEEEGGWFDWLSAS
jgi:hypothetical protein